MKKIIIWIVIVSIFTMLIWAKELLSKELTNDEMDNYIVCRNTETGVFPFQNKRVDAVKTFRDEGARTTVKQSGNNLYFEMDFMQEKTKVSFKKIDAGELKSQNIICFEPQTFYSKNGKNEITLTKADGTLNDNTLAVLTIFGMPLATEKDKK